MPKYEAVYGVKRDSISSGDLQSTTVTASGPQQAWVQLEVARQEGVPVRDVTLYKFREVK